MKASLLVVALVAGLVTAGALASPNGVDEAEFRGQNDRAPGDSERPDPPPPLPWLNDPSKMPEYGPAAGPDGEPLRDCEGNLVMVPYHVGPPTEEEIEAAVERDGRPFESTTEAGRPWLDDVEECE